MSIVAIKIEQIPFWKQLGLQIKFVSTCIISPLGGDRWLIKKLFVIESFIHSFKNADSSSNEM